MDIIFLGLAMREILTDTDAVCISFLILLGGVDVRPPKHFERLRINIVYSSGFKRGEIYVYGSLYYIIYDHHNMIRFVRGIKTIVNSNLKIYNRSSRQKREREKKRYFKRIPTLSHMRGDIIVKTTRNDK